MNLAQSSDSGDSASPDKARDYRERYYLPDQFLWHRADWARIDFDGYMRIILSSLPRPPARVLDAGCGPGLSSKILLQAGYEVTGVDFNERAIAFARLLVEGGRFDAGDLRDLDALRLPSDFDAVICVEVLEHVPPSDRGSVVRGLAMRLAPGGRLVLSTPSAIIADNPWDYPRPSLEELSSMIEAAGLRRVGQRFQHRVGVLWSQALWRALSNRFYDVRFARLALRPILLRFANELSTPRRAGRFVVIAERPEDPSVVGS